MITVVRLTKDGKVKHMYALKTDDFSAESLQFIFVIHASREAKIIIDKRRGFRLIFKAYYITKIKTNDG